MGVVWEAQHPQLERRVALKLLTRCEDPRLLERFQREGQVLARVQHPGVVHVHEAGVAPEGPYLVQELIEGASLDRVVAERGPLAPGDAARIARDVADALAAVHATGALHRDLKPHNVVLRPDGRPVLIDFGLVRDLDAERLTRTGEVMGSLSYMPPEQVEGEGQLDERSDVYGLGALLYHLLVGRPPFEGPTPQVIAHVLDRDPPWPRALRPDVPAALDRVVRQAMAKRREQRFGSARALRQALDEVLSGRPAPRGLARRAVPALALLAALAGGLGWALRARRAGPASAAPDPAPVATRALRPPPSDEPAQPTAPAPLWRLTAPRELVYLLSMNERAPEGTLDLQAELHLVVEDAPASGPARLRGSIGWLRIESSQRSSGMGLTYDTRQADPASPFYALQGLLTASFSCTLDPQDGAVRDMQGWDAMGRDRDLTAMRNVINDAHMRTAMHALTAVRGPRRAVGWELVPERAADWAAGQMREAVLPPAVVLRDPPHSTFKVTGQALYREGRLYRADLTQDGPRTTTWSMKLR